MCGGEKIKKENVWLTKELFNSWLTETKEQFLAENKQIFLIVENCSAHIIELATTSVIHVIKMRHDVWVNYSYDEVVSNPNMKP